MTASPVQAILRRPLPLFMAAMLLLTPVLMSVAVPDAHAADASNPSLVATHGKWSVYTFMEKGHPVCYMLSQPKKSRGNYTRRGDIYALVTDRPADGSKDVFSYIAGYPYKPGSNVTLDVDRKHFTLFTQDDTAWAPDAATDAKIASAIRHGSDMVVKGTSSHGTNTVDTFSLKGSGDSYNAMIKTCAGK